MAKSQPKRVLTQADVEVLLEEYEAEKGRVNELRMEVAALKREIEIWQKRSERSEQEALRWKKTADEWRIEFMKRSKGES
jgi:hypothetical protein